MPRSHILRKVSAVLFFALVPINAQSQMKNVLYIKQLNSSWLSGSRIIITEDGREIGHISCTKIPFVSFYALHSFYIDPLFRGKGFGTQLLNYAYAYLKERGAQRVYIQPGPFELNNNDDQSDYALKQQRLIALYKRNQFVFVGKWHSFFASLLYLCMGITEDSQYLMVRVVEKP